MAIQSSLKNMVLVLTGTCLVCSALLGGAYVMTKDPIAAAEQAKTVKALANVLPEGCDEIATEPETVEVDGVCYHYYVARKGGEVAGYAIESSTGGFGGIDAATGFICNTTPLRHNETPGLGAKCNDEESAFRSQWVGLNPQEHNFAVKQDIDAITASTITSTAYTKCVTQALAAYAAIAAAVPAEEPVIPSEVEESETMEEPSNE